MVLHISSLLLAVITCTASAQCLRGVFPQSSTPYKDMVAICNDFLGNSLNTISKQFKQQGQQWDVVKKVVEDNCFHSILIVEPNQEVELPPSSFSRLELLEACNCLEDITAKLSVAPQLTDDHHNNQINSIQLSSPMPTLSVYASSQLSSDNQQQKLPDLETYHDDNYYNDFGLGESPSSVKDQLAYIYYTYFDNTYY